MLIFALLDENANSSDLLSISKATQGWLLPLHYHSITFCKIYQIEAFYRIHDVPEERLYQRFELVHSVFLGRRAGRDSDLRYNREDWPVTILYQLLRRWKNLENIILVLFPLGQWAKLEHAIPASLKSLAMGPVHGPFRVSDLTQKPQLESFTSIGTFMRDEEVADILTCPSMKIFRRISPADGLAPAQFSASQLPKRHIFPSDSFQKLEYVVVGRGPILHEIVDIVKKELRGVTDDPRLGVHTIEVKGSVTVGVGLWEIPLGEYLEARRSFFCTLRTPLIRDGTLKLKSLQIPQFVDLHCNNVNCIKGRCTFHRVSVLSPLSISNPPAIVPPSIWVHLCPSSPFRFQLCHSSTRGMHGTMVQIVPPPVLRGKP